MANLNHRRIPPTHLITPIYDLPHHTDPIEIHNFTPFSSASLNLARRTNSYLHRLPSYAAVPVLLHAANIVMLAKLADSEAAGRPAPGAARHLWLGQACICRYRHDAYAVANGLAAPLGGGEAEAAAFVLTRLQVARDGAELAFLLGEAGPIGPPRGVMEAVIRPVRRMPGGWVEEGEAECPVCLEGMVLYGWYPASHGSTELEARAVDRRI
ncbi:hypothetical protein NpNSSI1_00012317 [Neofusicoccum parvum]|nr:hypothetical protein NpNSSI1_00012317 [Neofusicoccum parvum]